MDEHDTPLFAGATGYGEIAQRARAAFATASAPDRVAVLEAWDEAAYALRGNRLEPPPIAAAGLEDAFAVALADASLAVPGRARLLARIARRRAWDTPAAAEPLAREAIAAGTAAADPEAVFFGTFALHIALEDPHRFRERLGVSERLVDLARASGSMRFRVMAHFRRLTDAVVLADSTAYDHHRNAFVEAARSLKDAYWDVWSAVVRGEAATIEGEFPAAEECVAEITAPSPAERFPTAMASAAVIAVTTALFHGRLTGFESAMRPLTGARAAHAPFRIGVAYSLMQSGRRLEAEAEFAQCHFEDFPQDASYVASLTQGAELSVGLQKGPEVRDYLLEHLLPFAGQMVQIGDGACAGPVDAYLGILYSAAGDPEMADSFEAARATAAAMRARPWLARTNVQYAQAIAGSDPELARRLLAEAAVVAASVGLPAVEHRVRTLSARLGAPIEGAPRALSRRESEILGLVGRGMTATEIAGELVLSTRTVEKHIEHIYAKTGTRTRAEAAAYARQHPARLDT
jgi:DNA-binding CsgD family transcriptional regulator